MVPFPQKQGEEKEPHVESGKGEKTPYLAREQKEVENTAYGRSHDCTVTFL